MRRICFSVLSVFAGCLLLATGAFAYGHHVADYPLRVHIFQHNGVSHYSRQQLDFVDGEGRANLFESGEPLGFDFSYRCGQRLMVSPGFETYPARWKKPGRALEILQPQFGRPGAYDTCELKVEMKVDTVYHRHNGLLGEVPAAKYKEWMVKHEYDPEHGKDEPTAAASAGTATGSPAPTTPQ